MAQTPASLRSNLGSFALIGIVIAVLAGAFAYTAGFLSPGRLTPKKVVAAFAPASGPALGHRRNHAKGICFTGVFESNGDGAALSRAAVFDRGQYPVLGRFNLGTADPNAADSTVRVRGIGLQIATPEGAVWRSAMINAPVFPVSTPQAFYGLLEASKTPEAMKAFQAAHPELAGFGAWAGRKDWTSSYAEEPYHSLNAFVFVNAAGHEQPVRWALIPAAPAVTVSPDELAERGPNYLEQEITERVRANPQRWTLRVTLAEPGDPTSDPTKAWPQDRRNVDVGTLIVQQIEAEPDGPCRDINFDPTILPRGIQVSDDPFPAARSAAYARSYDLRTAETKDYPRTKTGTRP
ncbi:catalase family peroxidase [Pseudorhodoplanes sp.]|uniref:catalase family peroxidase n=1 Tax=Pseudorhodoplanes sp. TaxID=1934341 RepID=UPI002C62B5B5|nr:catalase family peroxidase [Pseudorhodoplanes sp.]HWV41474.1 catalase family peroxidase [Pseudorhodoplanes sp.]